MEELLSFEQALTAAKEGAKIARTGWNGAAQFVFVVRPPHNAAPNQPKYDVNLDDRYESVAVRLAPFLMLRNAQGGLCPWVPSTGDLFAADWVEVQTAWPQ